MRSYRITVSAVLLVVCAAAQAGPVRYRVVDLGTLPGGDFSDAFAIGNGGDVVGETTNADFDFRAFRWRGGVMTDLGTLGGNDSQAWGVNAQGRVVGQSETAGGPIHAFEWSGGAMRDLGALAPDGFSTARAINGAGRIVGAAQTSAGDLHAVTWEDGQIRDLGVPSAKFNETEARDVNASGRIVGRARTPGHLRSRAFLVENGAMRTLPTLGGEDAEAIAINDAGLVVGGSTVSPDGPTRAFLFNSVPGTILDLGTLGDHSSTAFDVNNKGQVVGQAGGAFLWENGEMLDLNDLIDPKSGWTLSYASSINDLGLIVGQGDNPDGESHAFLLTAIDSDPGPNPIPLPPAAWPGLATMVGVALCGARRRGRERR